MLTVQSAKGLLAAGCLSAFLWPSPARAQPRAAMSPGTFPEVEPPGPPLPLDDQTDPGFEDVVPTGLWGRPVRRGGFHLQVGFGAGGGPDSAGIFHTMELGWTFDQTTVAVLHTFILNDGQFGGNQGGPDLFGGWMAEVKHPLFFPDLVGKVALGLGGIHEYPEGEGIVAHPGFGASYGVDLHFPIWPRFGPTLTVTALHATALGQHHFGVGTALGVTLF